MVSSNVSSIFFGNLVSSNNDIKQDFLPSKLRIIVFVKSQNLLYSSYEADVWFKVSTPMNTYIISGDFFSILVNVNTSPPNLESFSSFTHVSSPVTDMVMGFCVFTGDTLGFSTQSHLGYSIIGITK